MLDTQKPKPYTILIIDDHQQDRALYRAFLKQDLQYSYHIIEAGAHSQPSILLQQGFPDAILLSVSSSYLKNVLEILSYLKLHEQRMNIPVILLTDQEDLALVSEAMQHGAYDCLGKATLNPATLCRAVQNVIERSRLVRQLEQSRDEQRLIWDIASRIRRSLNLEEVLQAVVNEVRQLLKADRVVVFRFAPDMSGKIAAESVLPEWASTLNVEIDDTCFQANFGGPYQQGQKKAITNIYTAGLDPCHIQMLEQFQVQANLVVPILLFEGINPDSSKVGQENAQLWGVLIAHQCSAPRQWQNSELDLLDQLAGQISIAIQQATALERAQTEIAERQRAEEEIQRSRNFLQAMIDYLPVAVCVKETKAESFGAFKLWNRASEQLFGFAARDVLEKTDYDLFPKLQANHFREKDQEAIIQGVAVSTPEELVNCQNLGQRLLRTIRIPVQGESNEPEYLLCIAEDITERQRAQVALKKREQLLTALVKIQQELLDLEQDEDVYSKVLELLGSASGATCISIHEKRKEKSPITQVYQRATWQSDSNQIEWNTALTDESFDETSVRVFPPRWMKTLESGEIIAGCLHTFSRSEQAFLAPQNVAAILIIPLMIEGDFFGFIRFDQHQETIFWETLEIDFIRAAVVAISLALEQKRATVALGRSQRRYAALAAAAPVGIFRTNAKGHCLYVNDRYCEIAGIDTQDALGIGWSRVIHEGDRHRVLAAWNRSMNQQVPFSAECRFQREDGIVWVWSQVVPERDKQGNVIGYIGTIGDITNRKNAEQALQRLNLELEQHVEQRTVELTQTNQQLIEEITEHQKTEAALSLRVERLNKLYHLVIAINRAPTIEKIYTAALNGMCHILKTSCVAVLVPDACGIPRYQASLGISEEYKKVIESYLETSNKQIDSKTVIIADSQEEAGVESLDLMREAEGIKASASFPIRYQGRHLGKIVIYYDAPHQFTAEEIKLAKTITTYVATAITRKQGEEVLQQTNNQLAVINSELARATRLKDEFLANMSHELRTPLNAILGMSDGLLDEMYGLLNDQQKKSISIIERSGKHLLDLINDILDLAKIESGKIELQITSVSVKSLCESSLSFIRQMALAKGIQVATEIPETAGSVLVDDRRFRQALINLLSNAVKFTDAGGRIVLEVQPDLKSQSIYFSVTDTGIGIAPENIEKLFQSFVQIDSDLDRKYAGTGLGLALVRQIVELHHGEITVESQVGQGSQFRIRLPYSIPESNTLLPEIERFPLYCADDITSIVSSDPPLILLAEDNEENTIVFSDYLSSQGYQLMVAKDGLQAVQLAKACTPNLILMDIQMPRMDGLTAIQHIRQDFTLSEVPIIALTALAMPGDRERCIAIGATQYMAKPVKLRELVQAVQQLVRN
ncbi:response regulator [Leptolyngbya boryana CZ1]|uniref:histidine kinase n=1 Tax=Leptolyngbya boryana CZ1 TaxID=3060204 RepID=A0AA96WNX2_LEPBY|nr:GAF domain-containing protein [Leptolyngbya boryana]WNZ43347.1 response regulator [Leptolyngbya boryana CZ1]